MQLDVDAREAVLTEGGGEKVTGLAESIERLLQPAPSHLVVAALESDQAEVVEARSYPPRIPQLPRDLERGLMETSRSVPVTPAGAEHAAQGRGRKQGHARPQGLGDLGAGLRVAAGPVVVTLDPAHPRSREESIGLWLGIRSARLERAIQPVDGFREMAAHHPVPVHRADQAQRNLWLFDQAPLHREPDVALLFGESIQPVELVARSKLGVPALAEVEEVAAVPAADLTFIAFVELFV